jgi:hypothetical protein
MFNNCSKLFLRTAILALAVPFIGLPASVGVGVGPMHAGPAGPTGPGGVTAPLAVPTILLNGTTVTFNGSNGPTSFNQVVTLPSGDVYDVSGSYSASYNSSGTNISFNPTVTYVGSSPSVANDVISVGLIQSFFDNSPGTWDGTYTETVPVNVFGAVGAGSSLSSQLSYSSSGNPASQSVNGPSPLTGTSGILSASADLTGLTGDTLTGDFELTFNLNAGSVPNSGIGAGSAVPEPSEMLPVGLSLAGVLYAVARRRRRGSKTAA